MKWNEKDKHLTLSKYERNSNKIQFYMTYDH